MTQKRSIATVGNPFKKTSLEEEVIRGMTRQRSQKPNKQRLYASSAGECLRRNVLSASETNTSQWTAAAELYTVIGVGVHRAIQDSLFREGTLIFSEYHLPEVPDLNLGGYVDAIALVDGKVVVVEIKTCGKIPSEPRRSHRLQSLIYSAITGLPAYVLYQSRSVASWNGEVTMKSYRVEATRDEILSVVTKLFLSTSLINKKMVPGIPPEFSSEKDCGFCPFKQLCWNAGQPSWPSVDAETYLSSLSEARDKAETLIGNIPYRRNGILRFLARYGTIHARDILSGDWNGIVEDPFTT